MLERLDDVYRPAIEHRPGVVGGHHLVRVIQIGASALTHYLGNHFVTAGIEELCFSRKAGVLVANTGGSTDACGDQGNRDHFIRAQALGLGAHRSNRRSYDQHAWARAIGQRQDFGELGLQCLVVVPSDALQGGVRNFFRRLWLGVQLAWLNVDAPELVSVHLRVNPTHYGCA
ncbi:hypothetical protein D3C79_796590 [compost metagenome]